MRIAGERAPTQKRPGRMPQRGTAWLGSGAALLLSVGVGVGITLAGWLLERGSPAESASVELGPRFSVEPPPPVSSPSSHLQTARGASPAALSEAPSPVGPNESIRGSFPPGSGTVPAEVIEGSLRPGDTLASALRKHGIGARMVGRIAQELAPTFNFRRAHPGDHYRLALREDGELLSFHYRVSPLEAYVIRTEKGQWIAGRETVTLARRRALVAGIVSGNLYDSVIKLGGTAQLAADFTSIFAWDLDFNRSVHPGDEFRILYQRLYRHDRDGHETYVGPGGILAARYRGGDREYTAVYFETEKGRGGYYRPDGSSVEKMFLAAPVRYRRISSSYSAARFHPILKVRRPHFGIDYAAPIGEPVWAVADGTVIFRGRAGGFGRLVKIRHANGYVSYYAHLSRFSRGLHVGKVVHQKQVIGYVGSSGLSTGPHVCFRIQKDGHYVNPTALRTPAGDPVHPELLSRFAASRDALLAELGPLPLIATDEAL